MRAVVVAGACALAAATAARGLGAQSLASRIDAVREGDVRLSFAARPGLCGDGENVVRAGDAVFVLPNMFGRQRDRSDAICYSGPVRVALIRSAGTTATVRVHLGGRWPSNAGVVDLGTVPAAEAARYFVAQARSLSRRGAEYAVVAAALADSVVVAGDLSALARTSDVREPVRDYAVMWLGVLGGDEARVALRALVTDRAAGEDLRGHAIVALAQRDIAPTDIAFLQAQYPSLPSGLHDEVFLALSRTGDPRAQRWLVDHVTNQSEPIETRKNALFWAGQGDMPIAQLIALESRLENRELREHFTFVLSQRREDAAVEKLIEIARRDPNRELRKQAMFWLGQSKSQKARDFLLSVIQG